jgi:hypothetical protein
MIYLKIGSVGLEIIERFCAPRLAPSGREAPSLLETPASHHAIEIFSRNCLNDNWIVTIAATTAIKREGASFMIN